jgi:hypothetical protein
MINKLLYKITGRLPVRLINVNDAPYLERYHVGTAFGWKIYLHRFVSSDGEHHLHNHPWRHGLSIILSGGYTEEVAVDVCPHASASGMIVTRVERRWFNRVDGAYIHRIAESLPNTWSLFMHGPRQVVDGGRLKGWGFFERCDTGDTRYTPAQVSDQNWHMNAPIGRDSFRVKL